MDQCEAGVANGGDVSSAAQKYYDAREDDDPESFHSHSDTSRGLASRACHHLQSHWKIVILGQVLSLLLASGNAAQATLHLDCDLSAPTFTMSAVYLILAATHMTVLFCRQGRLRQEQHEFVGNTHSVLVVDQARYPFLFGLLDLQRPPWQYFVMALIDVEANSITMLAFRFTTLTSVTLLDALAIPSAMILSKCFLNRQYTFMHLLGVVTCMIGIVFNVLQDFESDQDATDADFVAKVEYPHKLWGDVCAIVGGVLYGLSDVLTEAIVRRSGDTVEYLAIMGFFGFFISLVQSLALEWSDILEFFGHSPVTSSTCDLFKGWWLLAIFVLANAVGYIGGARFLMLSEAAFFNLSLLTGDLWSVVFSIFVEGIVPGSLFFVALALVLCGVILYEMGPHPVVEDTAALVAAQQLAEIDHEFELQDAHHEEGEDYDEDGVELL